MTQGDFNKKKTHCPQGHEYTKENTYINPQGRRWCRTCARLNNKRQNLRKYGLTTEQAVAMTFAQGWKCAICKKPFGFFGTTEGKRDQHIDHDHKCCDYDGSCGDCLRGILCDPCNRMLGCAKDSVETLKSAIVYLEKYSTN